MKGSVLKVINDNIGNVIDRSILMTEIYKFYSEKSEESGLVLDVGCGEKPYYSIYNRKYKTSIGFDISSSLHDIRAADFIASATDISIKNQICDCVFCTEVLEHVNNSVIVLSEFARILKPGGQLLLTTPFIRDIHEAPFDYFRFTKYGLKYLLEKNNFIVEIIIVREI